MTSENGGIDPQKIHAFKMGLMPGILERIRALRMNPVEVLLALDELIYDWINHLDKHVPGFKQPGTIYDPKTGTFRGGVTQP